jgi:hypothetical protein
MGDESCKNTKKYKIERTPCFGLKELSAQNCVGKLCPDWASAYQNEFEQLI